MGSDFEKHSDVYESLSTLFEDVFMWVEEAVSLFQLNIVQLY